MKLPDNFDLDHYMSLNRQGKIAYAKRVLPRTFLISYQNEIGKRLCPIFNPKTFAIEGFAGKDKVSSQLIFQPPRDILLPDGRVISPPKSDDKNIMFSIITRYGVHISSWPINDARFRRLEKEHFWVLKSHDIQ